MEEIFNNGFKIFTIVIGLLMSLGYFPQAWKIYKNKSSKDVSILSFVIFSVGTLTWSIYGIIFGDIVILLGFVLGVIGSWLVLILSLIYKRKK